MDAKGIPVKTQGKVIIVPVNGYINRLQAIASASAIASQIGWEFQICWLPEDGIVCPGEVLFSPEYIRDSTISESDFRSIFGFAPLETPNWLTYTDSDIYLRGHVRGEQAFMKDLGKLLRIDAARQRLVIVAGGRFFLDKFDSRPDSLTNQIINQNQRRNYYQMVTWSEDIQNGLAGNLSMLPDRYIGLHIRTTDRSIEKPSISQLRRQLRHSHVVSGIKAVYIAADSEVARDHWADIADELGLEPNYQESVLGHTRSDREAAISAVIDFLTLGHSSALVYTPQSSFGHEACVMSGYYPGFPASAPTAVRIMRKVLLRARRVASFTSAP